MPDLLAYTPITALDTPATRSDHQDSAAGSTSSAILTGTYQGAPGGAIPCGTSFTAPTTGRVLIFFAAELDNSTTGVTLCTPWVGTGAVVGSGTPVVAASDTNAIYNTGTNQIRPGGPLLVENLTPGDTYNVQLQYRATSGNGLASRRVVVVLPAP